MVKTGAISCVSCRQAFNDTEIQQDFIYCVLFERFLESAKKFYLMGFCSSGECDKNWRVGIHHIALNIFRNKEFFQPIEILMELSLLFQ